MPTAAGGKQSMTADVYGRGSIEFGEFELTKEGNSLGYLLLLVVESPFYYHVLVLQKAEIGWGFQEHPQLRESWYFFLHNCFRYVVCILNLSPFFCTCTLGMCFDASGVHAEVFHIGIFPEFFEEFLECTILSPFTKSAIHTLMRRIA